MASFEEVMSQVQELKANADETNGKMDLVVAKVQELKDMVAALQAAGGGATTEQLDQIASLVGETAAAVQSTEDKADSVVS